MTTPQKRALTVAVVTAVVGALALPLSLAAWNSKVSTSTYQLDMQRIANEIASKASRDTLKMVLNEVKDVKTILCGQRENRKDSACAPDRRP